MTAVEEYWRNIDGAAIAGEKPRLLRTPIFHVRQPFAYDGGPSFAAMRNILFPNLRIRYCKKLASINVIDTLAQQHELGLSALLRLPSSSLSKNQGLQGFC